MLRFMAWLCLPNDDYKGSQMVMNYKKIEAGVWVFR